MEKADCEEEASAIAAANKEAFGKRMKGSLAIARKMTSESPGGILGIDQHRWCGQSMYVLHHDRNWIFITEWNNARTEFIQDNSQRIDIAAASGWKSLGLFRRDIERITGISCRACKLHEARIGEEWFSGLEVGGIVLVEENIIRFNVTMHYALLMSIVNGLPQTSEKIDNVSESWKRACVSGFAQVVSECLSLDIIHDKVGSCLLRLCWTRDFDLMYWYNVRVTKRDQSLSFIGQACQEMCFGALQVRMK